jgi:peptide deformylase
VGEDCLRTKSGTLSPNELKSEKTQQLISLMIETLRDKPGVGLVAPQVGENLQIIVVEDKKKYQKPFSKKLLESQERHPIKCTVFINPKIKIIDHNKINFFEGCLSIEGYRAIVPRSYEVEVTALDRYGKEFKTMAKGWYSRILQHEIDHLNGKLYIDRMDSKTFVSEKIFAKKYKDLTKQEILDEFGL